MNNLANCHYFAATRLARSQSMDSFIRYKRHVLNIMAKRHGLCVRSRGITYFNALHRTLMGEFPDPEERAKLESELEELCLSHFGQKPLPQSIAAAVQR